VAPAPTSPISAGDGDDEARKQLLEAERLYHEAESDATPSEEKASKYAKVVEILQAAAEAGNAHAQYQLGHLYRSGLAGLAKDATKALELWERSAAGGWTKATWRIGVHYWSGKEGPQDLPKAKAAFTIVAEQEDDKSLAADAMLALSSWPDLNVQKHVEWLERSIVTADSVEPPTGRGDDVLEEAEDKLRHIAERRMTVEIRGHKRNDFNGQKGEGAR
jgi:TPR repeat protein